MINVVIYIRPDSDECKRALAQLAEISQDIPHRVIIIDVLKDEQLDQAYAGDVPLVQVGPFRLRGEITRDRLMIALGAARDRSAHLNRIDNKVDDTLQDIQPLKRSERISAWLSTRYVWVINALLGLFLGGAFLAPVLMESGAVGPAKVIYAIYSPFCHQLPFRSWFLFGEQAYYPRELAGIPNTKTFELISGSNELDIFNAREYLGDSIEGFKTALCQRDIAIFGSMLLFGLIYGSSRRKILSIKWYALLLIGVLPMLVDGASQLKSVLVTELPDWLPLRESTPLLRTITGGLFGFLTAWFVLPYIEESALMTRRMLARRRIIGQEINGRSQK
jgi:uncharacterized membrane protein